MTTLSIRNSINRAPLRLGFLLIPLVCFALSPTVQAQLSPAPDGGYSGNNTAEGDNTLFSLTTGNDNTANGFDALTSNTTGSANTATGSQALNNNTTGIANTANGVSALYHNTTGYENTANGDAALLGNTIGTENTASGYAALVSNTTGNDNTANGASALFSNTTGHSNTADGVDALVHNTIGTYNTANGYLALYNNTTAAYNTANGFQALLNNTTGYANTATGVNALYNNTTGNYNVALGYNAGNTLTTGSNNIEIASPGVAGDANTIRIGKVGTHTATFIAGISGATVSGGVAVYVKSSGQLGTLTSSARFKQDIHSMDKASEAILALKPVTFRYKEELDPEGIPQFGLVAEEVEKINPALVARDAQGKPFTVRYEAVNAMLLNEFLKEHRKVEEQARKAEEQEVTIARLNKSMEVLTARLDEQASQIQKVSAQFEASKPAPQMVSGNQ